MTLFNVRNLSTNNHSQLNCITRSQPSLYFSLADVYPWSGVTAENWKKWFTSVIHFPYAPRHYGPCGRVDSFTPFAYRQCSRGETWLFVVVSDFQTSKHRLFRPNYERKIFLNVFPGQVWRKKPLTSYYQNEASSMGVAAQCEGF